MTRPTLEEMQKRQLRCNDKTQFLVYHFSEELGLWQGVFKENGTDNWRVIDWQPDGKYSRLRETGFDLIEKPAVEEWSEAALNGHVYCEKTGGLLPVEFIKYFREEKGAIKVVRIEVINE